MNSGIVDIDSTIVRYPCMCGCGGLTRKRFCPGDDSILYRELIRHAATHGAAELLSFIYKNDDEATFDDQREAVADFFAQLESLAAD
jgi:hypothetical protein